MERLRDFLLRGYMIFFGEFAQFSYSLTRVPDFFVERLPDFFCGGCIIFLWRDCVIFLRLQYFLCGEVA